MGIFVFFGSAIILYVKARQGPGPYFFASLFACICLGKLTHSFLCLNPMPNLLLQISHLPLLCFSHILSIWYTFFTHLIPTLVASFFFYQIGKAIILPLAFASALSLLGSILLFPSSISSQFTGRLQGVLTPLISAIDLHRTLLNTPFPIDSDPSFSSSMSMAEYTEKVSAAATSIRESEAALGSLAASARLLKSDLIYGRFSPLDFAAFQRMCRLMSGRTNGLATFFSLVGVGPGAGIGLGVNKSSGDTPAHTVPVSPIGTPRAVPSRKTSMQTMLDDDEKKPHISSSPSSILPHSSSKPPSSFLHQRHLHRERPHTPLHTSLLSISHPSYDKPNRGHETEHAVGTFESQRYLDLEARRLWDPNWEEWTRNALQALGERWVCFLLAWVDIYAPFIVLLCNLSIVLITRIFSSQLRPRSRSLQRWSHCRKHLVKRCSLWQNHLFAWNPT